MAFRVIRHAVFAAVGIAAVGCSSDAAQTDPSPSADGTVDVNVYSPYSEPGDVDAVYASPECSAAWSAWNELIGGPTSFTDDQVGSDAATRAERLSGALDDVASLAPEVAGAAAALIDHEADLAVAFAEFQTRPDADDDSAYAAMRPYWDAVVPDRITVRTQLGLVCPPVSPDDL